MVHASAPASRVSRREAPAGQPKGRLARRLAGGRWIEPAMAVVLSAAALATSWAGYQHALWNGEQTLHAGMSSAFRVEAARAALDASTARSVEIGLFIAWLEARSANDTRLADFYHARMPPTFRPAFDEWLSQSPLENLRAAPSPFALQSYRQATTRASEDLDRKADENFKAGQAARRTADSFTRAGVVLAMAMFFGGIGQAFHRQRVRAAMAGVAIVTSVVGLAMVFSLPMLSLRPIP